MSKNIIFRAKQLTLTGGLWFIATLCLSQTPYISSVNPSTAGAGEVVNISGDNFPSSSISVFFGGAVAENIEVSESLIVATVPYGATFDQISVVNTLTGEIAFSNEKFTYSFDGQSTSSEDMEGLLGDRVTFATEKTQTQDLCTCDFDKDGDLDVVLSNAGATEITVFTNISTGTGGVNSNFTRSEITNPNPVTNVICGDIDGDGYADLVANKLEGEAALYVYRNNTATSGGADNPVFESRLELMIPNDEDGNFRKPGRIAIGDLDLDGHPETVVAMEDANIVYFFQNLSDRQSNPDVINFAPEPNALYVEQSTGSLGGLEVIDLNNDGFPEIIASNLAEPDFYVFENNSSPGSFVFSSASAIETISKIRTIKAGDINQDGFTDLVITDTNIQIDLIEIIKNTTATTGGSISFSEAIEISGINTSWGLDLGDIDGDNDLDIAIGSFGTNNFYVLMNENPNDVTDSTYSFENIAIVNNSRNIRIADMDNDGKPDFVFSHNSTSEENGFLGIKYNEACFSPAVTTFGSLKLCTGETVDLIASQSDLSYTWRKNGDILSETGGTLTVGDTGAGSYTAALNDDCNLESEAIVVTSLTETYEQPSFIFDNNSPCIDDEVNLTITEDPNTATYQLDGPNGFLIESSDPSDLKIKIMDLSSSGEYTLTTTSGNIGCAKTSEAVTLSVTAIPIASINNSATLDVFCEGNTLELSAPVFEGYDYEWKLDGESFDPIETDPNLLEASLEGDYSIVISGAGCIQLSEIKSLSSIAPPVSDFTASASTLCEKAEIDFTSNTTSSLGLTNTWDFGDGTSSETGEEVSHSFENDGTYNVSLTTSYSEIEDCTYTPQIQELTITPTPSGGDLDLILSGNSDPSNYEKCEENTLFLRVEDTYLSYDWKTIAESDTSSIGTNTTVSVINESRVTLELVDDLQCVFYADEVSVSNYTTGGINITTPQNQITIDPEIGKSIELDEGQTDITLLVSNATQLVWRPRDILEFVTTDEVIATPENTSEFITVEGTDLFECFSRDSVTLIVPGVRADKSFTPNGDGIGDCWEIANVSSSDCEVTLFDSKGRRIQQINFSPNDSRDDCVWDGTRSNGTDLPNGTYYYVMSCSDSKNSNAGAILMVR